MKKQELCTSIQKIKQLGCEIVEDKKNDNSNDDDDHNENDINNKSTVELQWLEH